MGTRPTEGEDPESARSEISTTSVRAFGSPSDLAELAGAIFGSADAAQRPAGWFVRKLVRECVDPEVSVLAWAGAGGERRPIGYCLVGRPDSTPGSGRTAGLGMLAPYRGRGIGRLLVSAAADACRHAGLERLRTVAAPERVGWYRSQGFEPVDRRLTLLSFARGGATESLVWGQSTDVVPCEDPRTSICEWLSEGWTGTPAQDRAVVRLDARSDGSTDEALLSREGQAVLVHRVFRPVGAVSSEDPRVVDALLDHLPRSTPVLLHACPVDAATTAVLQERGWIAVQDSTILTLALK